MSAGRNKNARTSDRLEKAHKSGTRKRIRKQAMRQLRKAKSTKKAMYRLKNKVDSADHGKNRDVLVEKLNKLKTREYQLYRKSKKLRQMAADSR